MSVIGNTHRTIEQAVHAALATVDDPEIHKPITELGMVKSVAVSADGLAAGRRLPDRRRLPDARDDHQAGHRGRVGGARHQLASRSSST